jgi:hypothetical protein
MQLSLAEKICQSRGTDVQYLPSGVPARRSTLDHTALRVVVRIVDASCCRYPRAKATFGEYDFKFLMEVIPPLEEVMATRIIISRECGGDRKTQTRS